jgi:hypothetical protein
VSLKAFTSGTIKVLGLYPSVPHTPFPLAIRVQAKGPEKEPKTILRPLLNKNQPKRKQNFFQYGTYICILAIISVSLSIKDLI